MTPGKPLPRDFYLRPTLEVAQSVLGCVLIADGPEGRTSGLIVEAEAYLTGDSGSHAFRGRSRRNATEAVLIRAVEPLEGLELMRRRRPGRSLRELASGPGRVCAALGITKEHDGTDLLSGSVRLCAGRPRVGPIVQTTRIGLAPGRGGDLPYRFYVRDSEGISRR
jgi:DNA-3-methyladenine glycosylase